MPLRCAGESKRESVEDMVRVRVDNIDVVRREDGHRDGHLRKSRSKKSWQG